MRIRRSGYICKKVKHYNPGKLSGDDVQLAYQAADVVFWRKFYHRFNNALDHFDDMKQCAVLRILECAGDIDREKTKFAYMAKIATNEMHNYLKAMDIYGSYFSGKMTSFEKNVEGSGLYATA